MKGSLAPRAVHDRVMHRTIIACTLVAAAALAGCRPDLTVPNPNRLPDLSGEWSYTASEIRLTGSTSGASCTIEGVTMKLGEWVDIGLFGRASEGTMRCTGELSPLSGPLPSYPVRRGGMVAHHIAFDFSDPGWRHEGFLSHDTVKVVALGDTIRRVVFTDTMSGRFRMRSAGVGFEGKFLAVRRARP